MVYISSEITETTIPVGGQGAFPGNHPKMFRFPAKIDFYYALFYSSDPKCDQLSIKIKLI